MENKPQSHAECVRAIADILTNGIHDLRERAEPFDVTAEALKLEAAAEAIISRHVEAHTALYRRYYELHQSVQNGIVDFALHNELVDNFRAVEKQIQDKE